MITEARVKALKEQGVGFITALRAPQIQALTLAPSFQLSLFDERGLCEVTSPEFPGERLVVCRNPAVAAERARKREELLERTEDELEKVKAMVQGTARHAAQTRPRGRSASAPAGLSTSARWPSTSPSRSPTAASAISATSAQIEHEALFDGIYVIRTAEPQQQDRLRRGRARLQAAESQRARVRR